MFSEGTEKQIAYAASVMTEEMNEANKAMAIITENVNANDIKPGKETAGELVGIRIVNAWKGVRQYLPGDFNDRLIARAKKIETAYQKTYEGMPAGEYLDIRVSDQNIKYGKTIEETLPLVKILEQRLGTHGDFEDEYKKAKAQKPKKSFLLR